MSQQPPSATEGLEDAGRTVSLPSICEGTNWNLTSVEHAAEPGRKDRLASKRQGQAGKQPCCPFLGLLHMCAARQRVPGILWEPLLPSVNPSWECFLTRLPEGLSVSGLRIHQVDTQG